MLFDRMDQNAELSPPADPATESKMVNEDVIEGHHPCQTKNGKWLGISNIYEKLLRPNMYDIGGTYIDKEQDFWFTCKLERKHGFCLIHLFCGNNTEGSYTVGVVSNTTLVKHKDGIIYLMDKIVPHSLDIKRHNQSYITTLHFNSEYAENILKGKKLYIGVDLLIKEEKNAGNYISPVLEKIKMEHDFKSLIEVPVGSDFIIESADKKDFHVHKILLSLHSDVFKAMLKDNMSESQTGRLKLVDVSSEDLKILIEYIYTCTVKNIENINFSNIVMLADRFNLMGLRQLCEIILIDQLNLDTAVDILVLADRFDCSNTKFRALTFIKGHKEHFKNIKFDEIDRLPLMKELFATVMS